MSGAGLGRRGGTDLGLSVPIVDVLDRASAAEIDVLARTNEHVLGGDDIGNRGVARVVFCEPDCDGDVVGGTPEGDGKETVETEKELGTAVVVSCGGDQS